MSRGVHTVVNKFGSTVKKESSDIAIDFDGHKYLVEMGFREHADQLSRKIIVFDGTSVGGSGFATNIKPIGAEGEIFDGRPGNNGGVRPQLAGFRWDPSRLHLEV